MFDWYGSNFIWMLFQQFIIYWKVVLDGSWKKDKNFIGRWGLFFHELEIDFEHCGTSHWQQEGSVSSACIFSGQFIEKSHKSLH